MKAIALTRTRAVNRGASWGSQHSFHVLTLHDSSNDSSSLAPVLIVLIGAEEVFYGIDRESLCLSEIVSDLLLFLLILVFMYTTRA